MSRPGPGPVASRRPPAAAGARPAGAARREDDGRCRNRRATPSTAVHLFSGPDRMVATEIEANVAAVKARLFEAARRAGRRPGEVLLVAVSKTVAPERVRAAIEAGV